MSLGYTDKTSFEKFAVVTIDAQLDTYFDEYLSAVEKHINHITGRVFIADSEAKTRLYDGDGSPIILIDDCIEITEVAIGNDSYGSSFTVIGDTGANRYFKMPTNYEADEVPIDSIELNIHRTIEGRENVKITGKWGYSVEVPDIIKHVTNVFLKGIIKSQQGGGDKISMEKIGNYSVSYDTKDTDSIAEFTSAKTMLEPFKRYHL